VIGRAWRVHHQRLRSIQLVEFKAHRKRVAAREKVGGPCQHLFNRRRVARVSTFSTVVVWPVSAPSPWPGLARASTTSMA
jgi:hypothetical protein